MKRRKIILLAGLSVWTLTACGGGGGPMVTDTNPPTISRMAVEPSTFIVPGTTVVQVEADVTDDSSGVDAVSVTIAHPDGSTDTKTLTAASGSTYVAQFTPTWGGNQPGTVRFTVSARDRAGNTQTTSAAEVRAAAPPPGSPW